MSHIDKNTFIILLHGLGATPITMIGIEKYLNWQGYPNTHKLPYNSTQLTLNECLDQVSNDLEINLKIQKNQPIILNYPIA